MTGNGIHPETGKRLSGVRHSDRRLVGRGGHGHRIQNRSFTLAWGLNPCKCNARTTLEPFILLFFLSLSHYSFRRLIAAVLGPQGDVGVADEIPGQELNEKRLRPTTTAKILRFQMPVKRPEGYRVTGRLRVCPCNFKPRKVFSALSQPPPPTTPSPPPPAPIESRLIRRGNTFSVGIPNNIKTVL